MTPAVVVSKGVCCLNVHGSTSASGRFVLCVSLVHHDVICVFHLSLTFFLSLWTITPTSTPLVRASLIFSLSLWKLKGLWTPGGHDSDVFAWQQHPTAAHVKPGHGISEHLNMTIIIVHCQNTFLILKDGKTCHFLKFLLFSATCKQDIHIKRTHKQTNNET